MFNGIIFNKGIVYKILKKKDGIDLFLKSKLKLKKKDIGVSVEIGRAHVWTPVTL